MQSLSTHTPWFADKDSDVSRVTHEESELVASLQLELDLTIAARGMEAGW